MVQQPLKPCKVIGCPNLTRGIYCETHNKQRPGDGRQSAAKRGYGRRWQKYAKVFIAKHPWCVHCLAKGIYTPATQVDHIKPHRGDIKLFWDSKNHQGLCASCHSHKTATEDGGFGR